MYMLQIQVATFDDLERIVACLKHSADPVIVKQVEATRDLIAYSDPAGLTDAESPAAKHFPNTTNEVEVTKPKNPRGRPRREVAAPLPESAAPEAEVTATPEVEAQAPAPQTYTLADIREALQGVVSKTPGDMRPATGLLAEFGAARVSEIPAERYADFVAACKAA